MYFCAMRCGDEGGCVGGVGPGRERRPRLKPKWVIALAQSRRGFAALGGSWRGHYGRSTPDASDQALSRWLKLDWGQALGHRGGIHLWRVDWFPER